MLMGLLRSFGEIMLPSTDPASPNGWAVFARTVIECSIPAIAGRVKHTRSTQAQIYSNVPVQVHPSVAPSFFRESVTYNACRPPYVSPVNSAPSREGYLRKIGNGGWGVPADYHCGCYRYPYDNCCYHACPHVVNQVGRNQRPDHQRGTTQHVSGRLMRVPSGLVPSAAALTDS